MYLLSRKPFILEHFAKLQVQHSCNVCPPLQCYIQHSLTMCPPLRCCTQHSCTVCPTLQCCMQHSCTMSTIAMLRATVAPCVHPYYRACNTVASSTSTTLSAKLRAILQEWTHDATARFCRKCCRKCWTVCQGIQKSFLELRKSPDALLLACKYAPL